MPEIKKLLTRLHSTGFFFIFLSTVLVKMVTFCQSIIVVRLLSKGDYGLYSYCNNIISMIMLFDGLGCIAGILQFGSECAGDQKRKNAFLLFGAKLGMITNVLTTIVIVILALTLNFEIKGAGTILLIMSFHPIFGCIFNLTSINLRINFQNNKYSVLNVIYIVLLASGVVLGAWLWQVKGIAWLYYVSMTLTIVIAFWMNRKYLHAIKERVALTKDEKKAFLKHSVFTAFSNASSQLMLMLDMFVIGLVIADELVLADYKAASTIPSALYFIPSAMMVYFYPFFVAKLNDKAWVKKSVFLVFAALFVTSVLIGVVLLIAAPLVIRIIFGEQYLTAVPVFRVLVVSFMVGCFLEHASYHLLVALKKTTFNFICSIAGGVLNVGLNCALVLSMGSIGAAIATLAVTCVSAVAHFVYLMIQLKKLHHKSDEDPPKGDSSQKVSSENEPDMDPAVGEILPE